MIQSILSNVAVILLSHLAVTTLVSYRERFSRPTLQLSIIFLMSVTIISMFYLPIFFGEYRFDLRLIPLIMLAMFSRRHITLSTLLIVCLWRFSMGGVGAVPGVLFGMLLPTLFALVYAKVVGSKGRIYDRFIVVTICWAISDLPILFILDDGVTVMKEIGAWRFSSFMLATLIYYTVIQIENGRLAMKKELQFLATHDQLTKLVNRCEFIRLAELKVKDKRLNHYVAMIDIDKFKKLNDNYGHVAGDEALIQMAQTFKTFETGQVTVGRYGGEEFMMHIRAKDRVEAVAVLKEIQEVIRQTRFKISENEAVPITVSIGLADWNEGKSLHDSIKEADEKLYAAKDGGRDQLVV